jgi:hypothetical protein
MGSPNVDQKTSQVQLPAWFEDASQWNIDQGRELANRDYTAYGGDRNAQFNPLQGGALNAANFYGSMAPGAMEGGYNMLNDTSGQSMMGNAYAGMQGLLGGDGAEFNSAGNAAQSGVVNADRGDIRNIGGGSFLDQNRDAYTNQYNQDVSNDVLSDINRQSDQQRNQNAGQAAAAGAFGGSRHGVNDALTQSEAQRNYGQMSNQLNQQGFDAASGLMGQDLNRQFAADQGNQGYDASVALQNSQLGTQNNQYNAGAQNQMNMFNAGQANNMNQFNQGSRASLLANMANVGQGMGGMNLAQGQALENFGQGGMNAQMGAGDRIQGMDQSNLNNMYDQFREARDWAANNFQYANAGMPNQVGQTTSQDVFSPNSLQQGISAGTALGGAALGGKSHSSFKNITGETNVEAVAAKVLDMKLYDWSYKPGEAMPDDMPRSGPLAEDFNLEFENPDAKLIDFQRHISSLHATIQSLANRIKELENK